MDFNIPMMLTGLISGLFTDVMWWRINYSKYEKGLEAHEHYHVGIEMAIVGSILGVLGISMIPEFLYGAAVAFFIAEWSQDHPFALKSGHFKESSIIGGLLLGALAVLQFIW